MDVATIIGILAGLCIFLLFRSDYLDAENESLRLELEDKNTEFKETKHDK